MISFSGGRTSGLMLRRCVEAGLRQDVHVLFANTGKEREETLVFVRECERRFGVNIHWLERPLVGPGYVEVDFASASRKGEPFDALIRERNFLPNPVIRFCTQELKIRVMKAWMLERGYEHWTNVVGMRVDEPRRVAKARKNESRDRWDFCFPLYEAGVTRNDVVLHWKKQPFDLQLQSWEGNCDLCFLRGVQKRIRIMEDSPDLADWWIEQERRLAATFRADAPKVAALLRGAQRQLRMFDNNDYLDEDPTDLGDCNCNEAA